MNQYTAKHFIEFFSAIPDEKWCAGVKFDDATRCCAITHAFRYSSDQGHALISLFGRVNWLVSEVNDRGGGNIYCSIKFSQTTPKARILAALEYLDNHLK